MPRKGKTASGETPGYLGDRLRAHKGHSTSQLVAQNIFHFGKNAKTAQILPHSMVMLMLSVGVMRNLIRTFIVLGSSQGCASRGTLRGGKEAVVGRVMKGHAIHCYVVPHHRVCVHIVPIATLRESTTSADCA